MCCLKGECVLKNVEKDGVMSEGEFTRAKGYCDLSSRDEILAYPIPPVNLVFYVVNRFFRMDFKKHASD